jgi:hypothetical protein
LFPGASSVRLLLNAGSRQSGTAAWPASKGGHHGSRRHSSTTADLPNTVAIALHSDFYSAILTDKVWLMFLIHSFDFFLSNLHQQIEWI